MSAAGMEWPPINQGITLDHRALGLDPDDIGHDVEDERAELYYHDGPLLALHGYNRADEDNLLEVAAWWEKLAAQAEEIAAEIRTQADSICGNCGGTGGLADRTGDYECPRCSGTGSQS